MTNAEKFLKDRVSEKEFIERLVSFALINGVNIPYRVIRGFFEQPVKPTLTEEERVILRNLHEEYKRIERNEIGNLYVGVDYFGMYDNLFQFIKNGEEYIIEELLNE